MVAVLGSKSLGLARTLVGLHLMRSHGFGALEAVAWLRIMQPCSILPEQLRYLVDIEKPLRVAGAFRPSRTQDPADPDAVGAAADGGGGDKTNISPFSDFLTFWHLTLVEFGGGLARP